MKTLSIDLGPRSYDIHIAPGLLDRAGEEIKQNGWPSSPTPMWSPYTAPGWRTAWRPPALIQDSLRAPLERGPNAPLTLRLSGRP